MKTAVFPGSFDPFTLGHQAMVERALDLFDTLVIAIGYNMNKQTMFTPNERKKQIEQLYANNPKVKVCIYTGLTIDFCTQLGATYIVRGLRSASDFAFEGPIAQANKRMAPQIETIFLIANPEQAFVSSTIARDVLVNGGDASPLIGTLHVTPKPRQPK